MSSLIIAFRDAQSLQLTLKHRNKQMCKETGLNTMSFNAMVKVLPTETGRYGIPERLSKTVAAEDSAAGEVKEVWLEATIGEDAVSDFFVK
jgi:hypothetical protein